jgi:hypothetical protein
MSDMKNSPTSDDVEDYTDDLADAAAPEAAEVVLGGPPEPGEEAAPEKKKLIVKSPHDEKREAIYKAVAERNAGTRGKEFLSNMDPANLYGQDAVDTMSGQPAAPEAPAPVEQPAPAAEARQAPQAPQEQMIEVVVDGQRMMKPLSDVVAAYQKTEAIDRRLQEAKEIVRQAKDLRTPQGLFPSQPDPEPILAAPQRPPAQNPVSRDELKDAVEKIQLGSVEEGVEAFEKIVSRIAQPQARDDGMPFEQRLALFEDQRDGERVLSDLKNNLPEVQDPFFQNLLHAGVERAMRDDLMNLGLSESEISARIRDNADLASVHKALRVDPRTRMQVRGVHEITQAGVESAYQWLNAQRAPVDQPPQNPAPAQVNVQARQERKQSLQPQPAPRTQPAFSQQPERRSTSQVVAAMNKTRGKRY